MKLLVETELFDNDPSATWDYINNEGRLLRGAWFSYHLDCWCAEIDERGAVTKSPLEY